MAHDILIVDDEADIRALIAGILEDEGYSTREAHDSDSAIEAVRDRRPSLIILDIWLQGSTLDGIELLRQFKSEHPQVPIVMISGHGTIETAVTSIREGAYDFIEKPFKSDRLLLLIQRAIEAARLARENSELRLRAGVDLELVGTSPAMNQVRQAIERVAPTGSRVLITGPAGAGKEVVARLLHASSKRSEGPFVVLNCASMHPERLEMELFGVEADVGRLASDGGETGAAKIGTFEQAHGGTLFLDEVADMPLETQGKIVRVLQDQNFRRVGGSRPVQVDVRVIASTNRDLSVEMGAGRFREDLYYRLNVVPIHVPAVKERREDIPELSNYFLSRASENAGLPRRRLSGDAVASLQAYDWPGNVRQIKNVMDWLLIMAPGEPGMPIRAEMLPPEIGSIAPNVQNLDRGGLIMLLPLWDARVMFEYEYLMAQIASNNGNISKTASHIDMERSAFHRKFKELPVGLWKVMVTINTKRRELRALMRANAAGDGGEPDDEARRQLSEFDRALVEVRGARGQVEKALEERDIAFLERFPAAVEDHAKRKLRSLAEAKARKSQKERARLADYCGELLEASIGLAREFHDRGQDCAREMDNIVRALREELEREGIHHRDEPDDPVDGSIAALPVNGQALGDEDAGDLQHEGGDLRSRAGGIPHRAVSRG